MSYVTGNVLPKYGLYSVFDLINEVDKFGGFIAGGFAKDLMRGKSPKDIDVWFPNEESLSKAQFQFSKSKTSIYETDNAIAFSAFGFDSVEFINCKCGNVKDVLDSFDFTVCKFALHIKDNNLNVTYHDDFFKDLALNQLVIPKDARLSNLPGTLKRAFRYAAYGFDVPIHTIQTICEGIAALDGSVNIADLLCSYAVDVKRLKSDVNDIDIPF